MPNLSRLFLGGGHFYRVDHGVGGNRALRCLSGVIGPRSYQGMF